VVLLVVVFSSLVGAQSSSDFVFDTDADPVMQVPGDAVINGELDLNGNALKGVTGNVEIVGNGDVYGISELNGGGGTLHLNHLGSNGRIEIGEDSGTITTDFNNQQLANIGGFTDCAAGEAVTGDGSCETVSSGDGYLPDDPASSNVDMDGNAIRDVRALRYASGNGLQVLETEGDAHTWLPYHGNGRIYLTSNQDMGGGGFEYRTYSDTNSYNTRFSIANNGRITTTNTLNMQNNAITNIGSTDIFSDGTINMNSGGDINSVENLNVDTINSNRGNSDILFHQGFTVDGDDGGDGSVTLQTAGLDLSGTGGDNQEHGSDSLRIAGHVKFDGSSASNPVFRTPGGGSDSIRIYDDNAGQTIAQFHEGGHVDIHNGNLDLNNNHITNLQNPNSGDDAATKNYVDNNAASGEKHPVFFLPGITYDAESIDQTIGSDTYRIFSEGGSKVLHSPSSNTLVLSYLTDSVAYVARSTDSGKSWSTTEVGSVHDRISGEVITLDGKGSNIYAAWADIDNYGGNHDVYISRSTDGGSSWSEDKVVYSGSLDRQGTSVGVVDANTAYVSFTESNNVYVYKTTDGGSSWSEVHSYSRSNPTERTRTATYTNGDTAFVAFYEDAGEDLVAKRTTDGGNSWEKLTITGADGEETGSGADEQVLTIDDSGSTVFIMFKKQDGTAGIARSTNKGDSWSISSDKTPTVSNRPGKITVPDANTALGIINENTIIYTRDGGDTIHWQEVGSPQGEELNYAPLYSSDGESISVFHTASDDTINIIKNDQSGGPLSLRFEQ